MPTPPQETRSQEGAGKRRVIPAFVVYVEPYIDWSELFTMGRQDGPEEFCVRNVLDRFDRLDTALNRWLVAHSVTLLRVSMGLVFLAFGALKFFPGLSPIEDLATRTTGALTLGLVPPGAGLAMIAALEVTIGLCFLTGRFLRVGVWLMGAQMVGAMSPLVLFPEELFPGPTHAPTLAAQYIVKDVILVAAAMVVASTWTGARLVAEPRSMRSTLLTGAPRVVVASRGREPIVPVSARRAEDYKSYAGSGAKGSGGTPRA